jgi:glycosyltransferase involved in cell wall biosynthesis
MRIGFTRAQFSDLKGYPEYLLFDVGDYFETVHVGYSEDKEWLNNPKHVYVGIKKLLPDFVSGFFVHKPYSPVSFVQLQNVEKALEGMEIIECAELYSFISAQCAKIAKATRKRLVLSIWETITTLPINHCLPYSRNVVTVRKNADVFIAHTWRAANYLKRMSVPEEKIKVIYPGVDVGKFHPSGRQGNDTFRILFVGRFDKEKGLHTLLKAFARLHGENSNTELWVRAKKRTGEVEALAHRYSQKYPIRFLGPVDYNKLPEIYSQCDVLCLPSIDKKKWGIKIWEEQFGFVLMEAMACGLPIVATDCGAIPEVIGTENLTVRQKSADDFYFALRRVIEDEYFRKRVSKLNRARTESLFDIEKQRKKIGEILEELTG